MMSHQHAGYSCLTVLFSPLTIAGSILATQCKSKVIIRLPFQWQLFTHVLFYRLTKT